MKLLFENWRLFIEGNEEGAKTKGPNDFLYDIATSSDKITITLLDPETKKPVESKKEGTNAYISLEKRTNVPHWEVSWSSSPKNSEKVGTIMYLMALETVRKSNEKLLDRFVEEGDEESENLILTRMIEDPENKWSNQDLLDRYHNSVLGPTPWQKRQEFKDAVLSRMGLAPDSYETSPAAARIWNKFMKKNEYGVQKSLKQGHEGESTSDPFNFVFFKPKKGILDLFSDKIAQKEVESEEKPEITPSEEEEVDPFDPEKFDWEELEHFDENLEDEIVGACLSGRASYEMVQKAAMVGIDLLICIGAPTSLAIDLAVACSITLIGFVNENKFNIYTCEQRILSTIIK